MVCRAIRPASQTVAAASLAAIPCHLALFVALREEDFRTQKGAFNVVAQGRRQDVEDLRVST